MRNATFLIVAIVGCLCAPILGHAQTQDTHSPFPLLHFGAGVLATFTQNFEFPTGASARLWILRSFGLELDVFTRENNPTFTIRALYRFLDLQALSLYAGGGVAFFSDGLIFDSTLQAALGIDIAITPKLLLTAEVGGILGSEAAVPISAAVGVHYYF